MRLRRFFITEPICHALFSMIAVMVQDVRLPRIADKNRNQIRA